MTTNWTDEERKIVEEMLEDGHTYRQISSYLTGQGTSRTRDSVRNFIRRNLMGDEEKPVIATPPKVLLFDIETLPIKTFAWGLFKQNIPNEMIIDDWCILSWAAKWLFDSKIEGEVLTPREAVCRNDKRISLGLWDKLDQADIVIAHNCDKFDVKKSNARFFIHKMDPPSSYQTIDTLKQSRKNFGFTSHKLNYISKLISNKEKIHTDFQLWAKCDEGNEVALREMFKYNKYDVTLLEEAYLEIRPWMKSGPNFGVYMDCEEPVCGNCGSTELKWGKYYYTPANRYRSFRCKACGGLGRDRISDIPKEFRKNLVANIAK